jgi:uncharacterized protein YbaA (DUF1428 family)
MKEISMPYVDGFVIPVPTKKLDAYKKFAKKTAKIWRDHGALDYQEFVADDVDVGKVTSFPRSVKLKPDETVVFSFIAYKNRAHRDRVNKNAIRDPRIASMDVKDIPFDGKRMIYGGFKLLVSG